MIINLPELLTNNMTMLYYNLRCIFTVETFEVRKVSCS